jgi:hypothetical protein
MIPGPLTRMAVRVARGPGMGHTIFNSWPRYSSPAYGRRSRPGDPGPGAASAARIALASAAAVTI